MAVDAVGQVFDDLLRHIHAVVVQLFVDDGDPRFQIGELQIRAESPLEPGKQSLLHSLQIHRSTIRGQYDLLVILMQVIEDLKKDILGFLLSSERVYIIYDEHIDHLIKVNKVVFGVPTDGLDELRLEFFSRHIQHCFFGILIFYRNADTMRQMGLAQSHTSIDEQGVE